MNIIILSDGANVIGGADKVAITSAIGLAKRGHKVHVIAAIGPIDEAMVGVENLTVHCTDQGNLSGIEFHKTRMWNQTSCEVLLEYISRIDKSDTIIHSHCYYGMLSSSIIDAAISSGVPTLITMHDYGIACPQRNFFHYRENKICHRKPLSRACICTNCTNGSMKSKIPMLAVSMMQKHRARVAERVDYVAFVSEFSQKIISPFLSTNAKQFQIQNPVDVSQSPRAPAESNSEFVFIGRMVAEKAPVQVARAAREAGVNALFIGDGPEREEVLRTNPNAECTGWLDAAGVHARLSKARAFVMPSIWYECSPLSTIEAQAHGLPVIVADTNASREAVEHGATGFIYNGGNVDQLIEAMVKLKDDETVRQLSETTYERFWSSPPSMERHLDRLEEVYREILGSARA